MSLVNAKIVKPFESLTIADIVKYCKRIEGTTGVAGSVTATKCQPGCLLILFIDLDLDFTKQISKLVKQTCECINNIWVTYVIK